MKLLSGLDIADYVKERQARQVRALRQAQNITPKLAIVVAKKDDTAIETYIAVKQRYGSDIEVEVQIERTTQENIVKTIQHLNEDKSVHGIIVQLPLESMENVDEILNQIAPQKDVDGLGEKAVYDPATPQAVDWLLAGYNVDLKNKHLCIVGQGKLVGAPLYKRWVGEGYDVEVVNEKDDLATCLQRADIIVSATGQPGLISSEMLPIGVVVVDAGVASESGETVGDVDSSAYERDDLTITPKKGGLGPLTVAVLFDNVIRSARP